MVDGDVGDTCRSGREGGGSIDGDVSDTCGLGGRGGQLVDGDASDTCGSRVRRKRQSIG